MFDLDRVLVVVTGGGGRIGAEIASAFASCRAKVVVADRDEEAARDVSSRTGVDGRLAWAERLDVADRTNIAGRSGSRALWKGVCPHQQRRCF